MSVKQVIVIRRDLKMRRGKEIAQGCHASMMFLSNIVREHLAISRSLPGNSLPLPVSRVQEAWLTGLFTKVCLQVPDEAALLAVAEKAKAAGLECNVVTDSGLTEFDGVPTRTCLAIGPDEAERIDAITGDLKLY